jgi:hypothetical protein
VARFLRAEFHDDSGLANCIAAFYDSILNEQDPSAAYREILLTASIMDRIFSQLPLPGTRATHGTAVEQVGA